MKKKTNYKININFLNTKNIFLINLLIYNLLSTAFKFKLIMKLWFFINILINYTSNNRSNLY